MFRKLLTVVTVPENDLPRVGPLLAMLIRGSLVATIVITALVFAVGGQLETGLGAWLVAGPSLAVIILLLGRLNRRGWVSLTANLLMAPTFSVEYTFDRTFVSFS